MTQVRRGPLLFAVVLAWPIEGLSREGHALAAVFAWAVAYWVTEALPVAVTALLSSVLAIALGVAPARAVLAPYGDLGHDHVRALALGQQHRDDGHDVAGGRGAAEGSRGGGGPGAR